MKDRGRHEGREAGSKGEGGGRMEREEQSGKNWRERKREKCCVPEARKAPRR